MAYAPAWKPATPVNKIAFFLLWCFIFVLPWDVFSYMPVLGSIPRLVGLAASAAGIVHILARGRVRPLSSFLVFAGLFVIWAGATTFWSIDPDATRARFLTYLQLAVLVWLIWEIAWSPERQRALLEAYVLGASVAAAATVYNYVSGAGFSLGGDGARFAALQQDPNELGLIIALAIPMAWYLGLAQAHRPMTRLWPLYLPLAITSILLTASRGAFLTMLVALMIIPALSQRLQLRTKAVLYVFAIGSLAVAARFAPEASLERIRGTRADIEAGYFGGRGRIWRAGIDVAREHPVAGVGAGAFQSAVEAVVLVPWTSHDTFLAILVEDGAVGLTLFLAMAVAATRPLRQLTPRQRRFGIVLLLALAVGSLSLEWDRRKQFWFVLGLLAASVAQQSSARAARRAPGVTTEAADAS